MTHDQALEAAALLGAIAHPSRLKIVRALVGREMSVGDIATAVGLGKSATSEHLTKLREAGMILGRRDSRWVYYQCWSEKVIAVLEALDAMFPNCSHPIMLEGEQDQQFEASPCTHPLVRRADASEAHSRAS